MKHKWFKLSMVSALFSVTLVACSELGITMPIGPRGASAYEVWVENVTNGTITDWPKTALTEPDYFKYLKGEKGDKGDTGLSAYEQWKQYIADGSVNDPHNIGNKWNANKNTEADFYYFLTGATGEDGLTPRIGTDGDWWIGSFDTNVPAKGPKGEQGETGQTGANGQDGKDGLTPHIGNNGNWWIGTTDTHIPAKGKDGQNGQDGKDGKDGKDGLTPHIGSDGNWWIGTTNTNVPAQGMAGKTPHIGNNGNWWIGTYDTQVPARGPKGETGDNGQNGQTGQDGANGANGKSAYELWVEDVTDTDGLENPKAPGTKWPTNKTTITDFWAYLRGTDGKDGKDGEPGTATISGFYNVLPTYYNGANREYVAPSDGSVTFQVYMPDGSSKAQQGVKVKGLPGIADPNKEYVTDASGRFKVPAEDLPDNKALTLRKGAATVTPISGPAVATAPNTETPNKVHTRITPLTVFPRQVNETTAPSAYGSDYFTAIHYKYERQIDGEWSEYPEAYPKSTVTIAKVKTTGSTVPTQLTNANIDQSADVINKWTRTPSGNFSAVKNIAMIIRPAVLSDNEKNVTTSPYSTTGADGGFATLQSTLNQYLKIIKETEWDNNKHYFTIVGKDNFYGEKTIMQAAIHNPEIYPAPKLKDIKIYITQGVTYLWGTIDKTTLQPFYYKYNTPTTGSIAWEAVKQQPADIETAPITQDSKTYMKLLTVITKNLHSSSGSNGNSLSTQDYKKDNIKSFNFLLDSTYPDNLLGTSVYIQDDYGRILYGNKNIDLYKSTGAFVYRNNPQYMLRKPANGAHQLEILFHPGQNTPIQEAQYPTDWLP